MKSMASLHSAIKLMRIYYFLWATKSFKRYDAV